MSIDNGFLCFESRPKGTESIQKSIYRRFQANVIRFTGSENWPKGFERRNECSY